jgi:hypothetical protein
MFDGTKSTPPFSMFRKWRCEKFTFSSKCVQNLAANFSPHQVRHFGFGGMKFLQLYCQPSIFLALWCVNKKPLTIRRGYGSIYPFDVLLTSPGFPGVLRALAVKWFKASRPTPSAIRTPRTCFRRVTTSARSRRFWDTRTSGRR